MKRVFALTLITALLVAALQPIAFAGTIMYAKYAVNLRSQPSTSGSSIYKTIPKGGQVTRLSSSSTNGYYRVSYKGCTGWALASAFSTSSGSGSSSGSSGSGGRPGGGFRPGGFGPTLTLSQKKLTFTAGDDPVQLTATVKQPVMPGSTSGDSEELVYTLTWTSLDPTVATVADGLVTPVGQGTCRIKCICTVGETKLTAKCTVKVKPILPTSVTLNETVISLKVGETCQLTATVKPDDATVKTVNWSSKKKKIASVSNTGLVTAVKAGTTKIVCKTRSGSKKATCTVVVS